MRANLKLPRNIRQASKYIMATEAGLEGFDVDAYAAKYTSRNRIDRLLCIAQKSEQLRADCYRVLLRDLRDGLNMKLYLEIAESASALAPESVAVDNAHVESVRRSCAQRLERLEQELSSYKSSMIKESIRVCFCFLFVVS